MDNTGIDSVVIKSFLDKQARSRAGRKRRPLGGIGGSFWRACVSCSIALLKTSVFLGLGVAVAVVARSKAKDLLNHEVWFVWGLYLGKCMEHDMRMGSMGKGLIPHHGHSYDA